MSKLYILDSTTISLFKAILKPAGCELLDGKSKGGIKAHTLLKADCKMSSFFKFSVAALHDQQFYQYISILPNGSIITFDKAYINNEQFEAFGQKEITCVVPQKENASYTHFYELELIDKEDFVLKDEMIQVEYKVDIEGATEKNITNTADCLLFTKTYDHVYLLDQQFRPNCHAGCGYLCLPLANRNILQKAKTKHPVRLLFG